MLKRLFNACMLRPADIQPSHSALEVVGTFNPAAVQTPSGIALLVRVAELPRERRPGFVGLPRWEPSTGIVIDWFSEDALDPIDPRAVFLKAEGRLRLTFISHLRVFWSQDGRTIDREGPRFLPTAPTEEFGVEDPRITPIDGRYYFTYVAVSRHGCATALASTADFEHFERHGIVFCPENKDVVLFPERFDGVCAALHRPSGAAAFSPPEMWLAWSPDLLHWGRHTFFHGGASTWETGRIGAGAPPIALSEGWLEVYHGNIRPARPGEVGAYCAGGLLMDRQNPAHVLKRSTEPLMVPEADFEKAGFVGDVVFPTGIVDTGDTFLVYYGAADTNLGVVEWSKQNIFNALG
ncbi:MAG: glycoside hydrolase family 130 protein [Candidatus Hydrogenedentota bacterium]